jgi:hypothetical protein
MLMQLLPVDCLFAQLHLERDAMQLFGLVALAWGVYVFICMQLSIMLYRVLWQVRFQTDDMNKLPERQSCMFWMPTAYAAGF